MGMNAAREPESRKEHVEKAEKISDARAEGHERIHRGGTVPQLFPGIHEKAPSAPEEYWCRKEPHHLVGIGHLHEEHADGHDRSREGDRPRRPALKGAYFFF